MRENWIDWIRVFGAIAIVVLHVTAREKVWRDGQLTRFDWWTLTAYETLTRIAVPLFFMISGYLVLNRCSRGDYWRYALRKSGTVLGLALLWTVVSAYWELLRDRHNSTPEFIFKTLGGAPYYHLWFLFAIATVYLAAPLLAPGLAALAPRHGACLGWLVPLIAAMDFVIAELGGVAYYRTSFLSVGIPYVSLAVAGYLLVRPTPAVALWLLSLIYISSATLCMAAYGYLYGGALTHPDHFVFFPLSPLVVIMSLSAFQIAKLLFHWPLPNLAQRFANDSLGIYLVHPFVLDVLNYLKFFGRYPNALVGIGWMTLLILAGSWVAVFFMKQIPFIRRMVTL